MKQVMIFLALVLTIVSCGTRKGYFSIEGRFLNLNQGELYVYSTDGVINGIDTIKVNGGRFALELPCTKDGTLIIVFPNYSEQPIFAESGKSVDIKADASHLKQMKVTGTDDNELMTDFRLATASSSPPDVVRTAENFIIDNPKSPVAVYLLHKYFISTAGTQTPAKAHQLLSAVKEAQPKNGSVARMEKDLNILAAAAAGNRLQPFTATDTEGRSVSAAMFRGKTAVICAWASWSSESCNMMREISERAEASGGNTIALGISLDADKGNCKKAVQQYGIKAASVCDGQLFDSPLLQKLGMHSVPDAIIIAPDGRIKARAMSKEDLDKHLKP